MIDENYLQNAINQSIDPDGLRHCLGIFTDETGKVDWGEFYGLDENCCVSLGIKNFNPDEVAEILNAYKIPAVSVKGEFDASKILVTDTGIKLPLQRPEDAVAEINDIINVDG